VISARSTRNGGWLALLVGVAAVGLAGQRTWYVFADRLDEHWASFLVLAWQTLYDSHDIHNIGSLTKQRSLSLYCLFTGDSVLSSGPIGRRLRTSNASM
jgi:hypothetical protein